MQLPIYASKRDAITGTSPLSSDMLLRWGWDLLSADSPTWFLLPVCTAKPCT